MLQLSYIDLALLAVGAFASVGMIARLMLEEHRRLLSDIRAEIEEERARIEREKRLANRPGFDEYDAGDGRNPSSRNPSSQNPSSQNPSSQNGEAA